MEPWFDTHVHLDRYSPEERDSILKGAGEASVALIAVSVDMESAARVAALAGTGSAVAGAVVGVHPAFVRAGFEDELRSLARGPRVIGIGELGFDAAGPDWDVQAGAFAAQCAVAGDMGLPVVLHVDGEGAWERLLERESSLEGLAVVRHYFTGDGEQAGWHARRDHYLSFGNPLRRDARLREIARHYPDDLLLIETDSYPLPGRNTRPSDVIRVGETLALVRGWTFEEARERLAANTHRAFPL